MPRKSSPLLRQRTEEVAEILRSTDARNVEVGFQTWPGKAVQERAGKYVLLIGISSSHDRDWTHDQRPAPSEPRLDAWIYVHGAMLVGL